MVFQNYALYPHMSVYDNMAYGLKIRGFGKDHIRQRVEEAARIRSWSRCSNANRASFPAASASAWRWGAPSYASRRYSCSMSRCPTGRQAAGADAPELQQLHRRLKTTSLYVTHDQVEAMTLAQRVIVMNKGVAEQIGTPSEVYQRPASLFVAGFIGSPAMNLLPGTLSADGGQLLLADGMVLPLPAAKPQWAGRQLTLGIRPEHIQRVAQGRGVPLQLQTLELLGPTIWRTASGAATG